MKVVKSSRFYSLRFKLITMCLLLLAVPSIIGYNSANNSLNDLGARSLKNNVRFTIEMIDSLHKYVEEGKISMEEAQEQVKIHILGPKQVDGTRTLNRKIDVGQNGYLYVVNDKGTMIANPTAEGQETWDTKGPDGTLDMQDIIDKATKGGGYTPYQLEDAKNPGVY